jgi:hypothetical protein
VQGTLLQLVHPLYTGRPVALFAPQHPRPPAPVTPENVLAALRATRANVVFVVPSLLEVRSAPRRAPAARMLTRRQMWVHDADVCALLRGYEMVCFGGGPLAQEVGDALVARGVNLACLYGGTEFGAVMKYAASAPACVRAC